MSSSVKKAFKVLSFISRHQGTKTLSELGRDLNINKTTLFRYIHTLEALHVIEKKNNLYYLGLKMFELGSKVHLKQMLREKTHNILEKLCNQLNETVNLAQIYNSEVLYIDKIESRRSLQIQTSIGSTAPIHCTALGKAILSILPDQQTNKIIKNLKLSRRTNLTISNKKELLIQLKEIQKKGYSIDNEEFEEGLKCVAVPFYLEEFNFYGGISLSGPSIRFSTKALKGFVHQLEEAKKEILKELEL